MVQCQNAKGEPFTRFTSVVDLSSLCGKLPDRAFQQKISASYCTYQKIILGDNVTEIGESAFENSYVANIIMPSKLKRIGRNAFKGCTNLVKLELPETLEVVEEGALGDARILASPETIDRIINQQGYIEYAQKVADRNSKAEAFIQKYQDYFGGKKTEKIPNISEIASFWMYYGQNPKIYKRLIDLLKATSKDVNILILERLIKRAQFLDLESEREAFVKLYNEKKKNEEKTKPSVIDTVSKTVFDFNVNTTFTSYTPTFTYSEEERQRANEILREIEAQKRAEIYVGYLLGDIPTPPNIDELSIEFSDIDWSEWGDV